VPQHLLTGTDLALISAWHNKLPQCLPSLGEPVLLSVWHNEWPQCLLLLGDLALTSVWHNEWPQCLLSLDELALVSSWHIQWPGNTMCTVTLRSGADCYMAQWMVVCYSVYCQIDIWHWYLWHSRWPCATAFSAIQRYSADMYTEKWPHCFLPLGDLPLLYAWHMDMYHSVYCYVTIWHWYLHIAVNGMCHGVTVQDIWHRIYTHISVWVCVTVGGHVPNCLPLGSNLAMTACLYGQCPCTAVLTTPYRCEAHTCGTVSNHASQCFIFGGYLLLVFSS
jgi:hypothetical protein